MNREQANALVEQTFKYAFDKNRFLVFSRNLLNRIDESKASAWRGQVIKRAFEKDVSHYERLGTYTSPDNEKLDVLVVHLTKESKLERARTAIRNFVADHLKTRDEKDAALVAFVSPTEKQWRFSYVKMAYATVEKESGKIGVEARLTPARRFSYIVGEGESCHTAQTRFLDLLKDTDTDPALADIEEAFSVEAVTKEFFTKYAELFEKIEKELKRLVAKDNAIRDEFKAKSVNPTDFAKKLMGQIVFLYFLQKKGWLGVEKGKEWGTGPHDFLRRLAKCEYGKYNNFFNDILEPLFYYTLATDRGHEAWDDRFKCRIPFLNGGLFEPLGDYNWKKTDIILPNTFFTNNEFVEEGIAGTGVLDMFDRYNFTVNEAEPLEKEVAIDPEMLGKVFENLIEENRRKSLGARYTPREIVHYMCQESLIHYLDTALNKDKEIVPRKEIETFIHLGEQISHYEAVETKYRIKMPKSIQTHAKLIDEKLAEITVCDPAVGSGAFPVGMMTEIVRCRMALTPYFNDVYERTAYHFKRHAIQNCLYGVDIDPGAVEIAKLRLWLSLVVDEEEARQIKPLPNLDYKIMQGNSLIEEYEGIRLFDEGIVKAAPTEVIEHFRLIKKRINNLQREYIELHSANKLSKIKKDELKDQVKDQQALLKRLLKEQGIPQEHDDLFDALSVAKRKWIELKQKHKDFFEASEKPVKDDLRKRISELEWDLIRSTLKEEGKNDTISHIEEHVRTKTRPFFLWRLYFAEVFEVKRGFDVVIANPPYIGIKGIPWDLRRLYEEVYLTATGRFDLYSLFIERAMQIKSARGGFAFIIPGKFLNNKQFVVARKMICKDHNVSVVKIDDKVFEESQVDSVIVQNSWPIRSKPKYTAFRMSGQELQHLSETNVEMILQDREAIFRLDIDTALDRLILKIEEGTLRIEEIGEVRDGIVAGEIKDILFLSKKLDQSSKKLYLGKHISRYHLDETEVWVNYKPDEMMKEEVKRKRSKRPGLWMRDKRIFEREKIIYRKVGKELIATFGDEGIYYEQTVHSAHIADKRLKGKYVLGLFNSNLFKFYYQKTNSQGGDIFPQVRIGSVENLPIKLADKKTQSNIEKLVDQILAAKKKDPNADMTSLEREIDQLVYKVYGLTQEEIETVKNSTAK